tara:strand:- start:193 stop:861 length:669 start_codon:yes stop_codon:yes gene_type:complete
MYFSVMMKFVRCFFCCLVIFSLINCQTHYYSTSLNLPVNKFQKGYKKFNTSFEILPSAEDEYIHDYKPAASFTATFGLDENKGVDTKIWICNMNVGISANLYYGKEISENSRFYSCPRIGLTSDVWGLGLGLGYSGIYQKTFKNKFSFFSGLGLAFGTDLTELDEFGNILLLNLGLSQRIKNLYLSIEFNPSLQKYIFEQSRYFGVANTSFSVGYVFRESKK